MKWTLRNKLVGIFGMLMLMMVALEAGKGAAA